MGDITGLGSVADLLKDGLDKIFPDKTQAEAAKNQLLLAEQQGKLQEMQDTFDNAKAQISVNAVEAASTNVFVAGWRPFIGWICGAALLFSSIIYPLMLWAKDPSHPPVLDTTITMQVLFALLGIGAMRSFDKQQGTLPSKGG